MSVNLDIILLNIFKIVGAFVVIGAIAYLGILLWWEAFKNTKTAKMLHDFIKDNMNILYEWYAEHYEDNVKLEGIRYWLFIKIKKPKERDKRGG